MVSYTIMNEQVNKCYVNIVIVKNFRRLLYQTKINKEIAQRQERSRELQITVEFKPRNVILILYLVVDQFGT